ncbi:hypothetical protein G9A89_007577 [Geosiphon pyriformis]|nr:hypothetical protein G9A89_007577 [Geosiphon pyriformis]
MRANKSRHLWKAIKPAKKRCQKYTSLNKFKEDIIQPHIVEEQKPKNKNEFNGVARPIVIQQPKRTRQIYPMGLKAGKSLNDVSQKNGEKTIDYDNSIEKPKLKKNPAYARDPSLNNDTDSDVLPECKHGFKQRQPATEHPKSNNQSNSSANSTQFKQGTCKNPQRTCFKSADPGDSNQDDFVEKSNVKFEERPQVVKHPKPKKTPLVVDNISSLKKLGADSIQEIILGNKEQQFAAQKLVKKREAFSETDPHPSKEDSFNKKGSPKRIKVDGTRSAQSLTNPGPSKSDKIKIPNGDKVNEQVRPIDSNNSDTVNKEVAPKPSVPLPPPPPPRYILFVSNLPYSTKKPELALHFDAAAVPKSIRIVTDKVTKKPKGYAFIEFENEIAMKRSLRYHKTIFKRKMIHVLEVDLTSGDGGNIKTNQQKIQVKKKLNEEREPVS